MKCHNCSKNISVESKFCRFCGEKVMSSPFIKYEYAGFWVRLGAYLIDLIGLFGGAIAIGLFIGFFFGEDWGEDLPDYFWSYFSYVLYNTVCLSIWSTTLGKYFYGLRVLDESQKDVGLSKALMRSLLQPISTLFFGIGYWGMNKNSMHQSWHDTVAKTAVIREKKNLIFAYIMTIASIIIFISIAAIFTE